MRTRSIWLTIGIGFVAACLAVLMASIAAPATAVLADTPVSGNITISTTWTITNSPYIVESNVTIGPGAVLTIQPGVVVSFTTGGVLDDYQGTLVALGTSSLPITFTSAMTTPHPGDWYGIVLRSPAGSRLGYCDIAYAGGNGAYGAINIQASPVQVSNCRIHDGVGDGLYLNGPGLTPLIHNVTIDHQAGHAVLQSTLDMNPVYQNLTLVGNGVDGVSFGAGNSGWVVHSVMLDSSPAALNGAPIFMPDTLLWAGSVLTITPGSQLRMPAYGAIDDYQGKLVAVGTPSQPITFTSAMTTPHPGDWYGILLRSPAASRLGYCDIAYAGGNSATGALTIQASPVQVSNCRIHDGGGDGHYLNGTGLTPLIHNVTIDHQAGHAVLQTTLDMNPVYQNLTLASNGVDGVSFGAGNSGWVGHSVLLDGSPAALNGAPIFMPDTLLWAGSVLTITPGSQLRMPANGGIDDFLGKLVAVGTPSQPITFTSAMTTPHPGHWVGIVLRSPAGSRLGYCDIAYAGGNSTTGALTIDASAQVRRCRIHQNSGTGIYVNGTGLAPDIEDTRIDSNSGKAVSQTSFDNTPTYHNLSVSGNGMDAIVIGGGTLNSLAPARYAEPGAPLLMNGSIGVAASRSLILGAGASLNFTTSTSLQVNGNLYLLGAATNPVTLTAQSGTSGGWNGLQLALGSFASLANCDIAYGGGGGTPLVNILSNNVSLQNCRLHHSAADGLQVGNVAVTPTLLYNQVYSNAFGLRNLGSTTLDARNLYWGTPSGPFHSPDNTGGTGNAVSDRVLFSPWLNGPPTSAVAVEPLRGGNTGNVSVLAAGLNFGAGASLKLSRNGSADIIGTLLSVNANGTLNATLNLQGALTGAWDVVITNGSGLSATIPGGFTVEAGRRPDVWVDILGRATLALSSSSYTTYLFTYGNDANVDAPATHLIVDIPITWTVARGPELPFTTYPVDATGERIYDIFVPRVAMHTTSFFSMVINPVVLGNSQITFVAQSPASTTDLAPLLLNPAPPMTLESIISTTNSLTALLHYTNAHASGSFTYTLTTGLAQLPITPIITITVAGDEETIAVQGTIPEAPIGTVVARGSHPAAPTEGIESFFEVWEALKTAYNGYAAPNKAALIQAQQDVVSCLRSKGILGTAEADYLQNQVLGASTYSNAAEVAGEAPGLYGGLAGATAAVSAATEGWFTHQLLTYAWEGKLQGLGFQGDGIVPTEEELYTAIATKCGGNQSQKMLRILTVTAHDPNEKDGPIGAGVPRYLTGNQPLRYVIGFENVFTATAPAQEVVVTDTLDANNLDLSTLQLTRMSFSNTVVTIPFAQIPYAGTIDLRPSQNLLVRLSASLDPLTHVLTWRFTSVDPATGRIPDDPLVGLLPPDTDGGGVGSVSFTVTPKAGLATGTAITNQASVVFDTNDPMQTNTWLNTIDNDPPQSHVTALPATQLSPSFGVSWSGTDTGAGIQDYTVYVSKDGGPYTPWLTDTTATSATYTAPSTGTYAFFSAARDGAGNNETPRFTADATTRVLNSIHIYLPIVRR
jgi:Right handed beta helix region